MPRLIINADDFGFTGGVNRAILEAHREGVVTSTTLMANAPAFDDAVSRARTDPSLKVGCHVVLLEGQPLLPPQQVPTLLAGNARQGALRASFIALGAAAVRGRLHPEQVAAEAGAQMRRIQDAGLVLTHFDAHKHSHIFPQVLRPLLRAAAERGVPAVRNPFAPLPPLAWAHVLRRPRLFARHSALRLLRRFHSEFCRAVAEHGLKTTDGTVGVVATGSLDETLFAAIVGCLPEGTWEFVCHPGYCDQELRRLSTRLYEQRAAELAVLTSPAARQALEKRGVELISYADL